MGYEFSIKKMLKKAARAGLLFGGGGATISGFSGGEPSHGIWAGLMAALFTCGYNYLMETVVNHPK